MKKKVQMNRYLMLGSVTIQIFTSAIYMASGYVTKKFYMMRGCIEFLRAVNLVGLASTDNEPRLTAFPNDPLLSVGI